MSSGSELPADVVEGRIDGAAAWSEDADRHLVLLVRRGDRVRQPLRLLIAEPPDPLQELGHVISMVLSVCLPKLVDRRGQRVERQLQVAGLGGVDGKIQIACPVDAEGIWCRPVAFEVDHQRSDSGFA